MRLSQRADYAAHAMVEIARWYGERPVHATEIARRAGIHADRIIDGYDT